MNPWTIFSVTFFMFVTVIYFFYLRCMFRFLAGKHQKRLRSFLEMGLLIGGLTAFCMLTGCTIAFVGYLMGFAGIELILILICERAKHKRMGAILRSGLLPIVLTMVVCLAGMWNMKHVRETEYTIETDRMKAGTKLELAVVSDIHYGTAVDRAAILKLQKELEEKPVDLLLLVGDIVDESTTKEEMLEAISLLGKCPARYGIYYVYGNHDESDYSLKPNYTTQELKQALTQSGIRIVEDESIEILDQLYLVGRKGSWVCRKTVTELLEGIPEEAMVIVMDHQPKDLQKLADAGVTLSVSGHTHDGQIWPMGIVCELLQINEMQYGERSIGNLHAITTSGMSGWGCSVRTEGISEYVRIHLQGKTE